MRGTVLPTTLQSLKRPLWTLSVDTSSKQAAAYKRFQVKYNNTNLKNGTLNLNYLKCQNL